VPPAPPLRSHILNPVGQAIIFGRGKAAYDNAVEEHNNEEEFMDEWRKDGLLGVLIGVINYMKSPTNQAIRQLVKGCQLAMNSATILAEENRKLRTATQRQRRKQDQRRQYIARGVALQA
jgi:hypothetical protein